LEANELILELQHLHSKLAQKKREMWNRSLPLEELLFDRWYRASSLKFGEGSSIYHNSYVYGLDKLIVGKYVWIGPFTIIDAGGGLTIGDYVSISSGVQIYTHDSVKWALSGGKESYESEPTVIESCCHIGASSIIAKGVTIGAHSAIGANSFVRKNVEPYSIMSGSPAIKIGTVVLKEGKVEYDFNA
jgi:acetyltransferase-like isoleucine patch superfamily enzyme